jgi:hypothetical protein
LENLAVFANKTNYRVIRQFAEIQQHMRRTLEHQGFLGRRQVDAVVGSQEQCVASPRLVPAASENYAIQLPALEIKDLTEVLGYDLRRHILVVLMTVPYHWPRNLGREITEK